MLSSPIIKMFVQIEPEVVSSILTFVTVVTVSYGFYAWRLLSQRASNEAYERQLSQYRSIFNENRTLLSSFSTSVFGLVERAANAWSLQRQLVIGYNYFDSFCERICSPLVEAFSQYITTPVVTNQNHHHHCGRCVHHQGATTAPTSSPPQTSSNIPDSFLLSIATYLITKLATGTRPTFGYNISPPRANQGATTAPTSSPPQTSSNIPDSFLLIATHMATQLATQLANQNAANTESENTESDNESSTSSSNSSSLVNQTIVMLKIAAAYDDPTKTSSINFTTLEPSSYYDEVNRLAGELGIQFGSPNLNLDFSKFSKPNQAVADLIRLAYFIADPIEFSRHYQPRTTVPSEDSAQDN